MRIGYHVSEKEYDIGEVVSSNNYIDITLSRGNSWVENLLESHRPKSYPNRKVCVFTFDSIDALGYYSDYLTANNIKYYKVELLDTPYICPMFLCGFIQKNQGKEKEYLDKLAIEYWCNTMGWNFNEQLCGSFRILEYIPKPTILQKLNGMGMYNKDEAIALKIKCPSKNDELSKNRNQK